MSYTYYPKNGKQVNLFGIPVGRAGREFPFPVKDYETGVSIGVLVRTPQEMENYIAPKSINSQTMDTSVDEDLAEDINAAAEAELLKAMAEMGLGEKTESTKVETTEENSEPQQLTKEEAFKYIKMEADGTYAKHADGTYKIKGGWKPYTKEEIYKALEE